MKIQFQQVEPLNDLHHDKIIAAFNELFINGGGLTDGSGYGYGYDNGDDSEFPEELRVPP